MTETEHQQLAAWLSEGKRRGWISEPFCDMHDAWPKNARERDTLLTGGDPCMMAVRLWSHDLAALQLA
jgi:hypothetical protein